MKATLVALSGTGTLRGSNAFVANPSLFSSGSSRQNNFARVRAVSARSAHESRVSCPKMGLFPKSGGGDKRRPHRRHLAVNPVAPAAGREGLRRGFAFLRRAIDDDNGEVEEEEGDYEYEDEEVYDDGLDRCVSLFVCACLCVYRSFDCTFFFSLMSMKSGLVMWFIPTVSCTC